MKVAPFHEPYLLFHFQNHSNQIKPSNSRRRKGVKISKRGTSREKGLKPVPSLGSVEPSTTAENIKITAAITASSMNNVAAAGRSIVAAAEATIMLVRERDD